MTKKKPGSTRKDPFPKSTQDEIAEKYLTGDYSFRGLAKEYNTEKTTISRIIRKRQIPLKSNKYFNETYLLHKNNPEFNKPGEKFNSLTLLKVMDYKDNHGNSIWKCLCDCGKEKFALACRVRNGYAKNCGSCRPHKKPPGNVASKLIYTSYKRRAEQKLKLNFDLSFEDFIKITQLPCYYCGTERSNKNDPLRDNGQPATTGAFYYNGIDRVDNAKGYSLDNCVSCCRQCNCSKSNYSKEEFIAWINKSYEYLKNKDLIQSRMVLDENYDLYGSIV